MRYLRYYDYIISGPDTCYCITSELLLEILLSWLPLGFHTYPHCARNVGLAAKSVATGFPELVFPASLPFGGVWSKTRLWSNSLEAKCRNLTRRLTNWTGKVLIYYSNPFCRKVAVKEKQRSVGWKERKFRVGQKNPKEMKVLVCSEK